MTTSKTPSNSPTPSLIRRIMTWAGLILLIGAVAIAATTFITSDFGVAFGANPSAKTIQNNAASKQWDGSQFVNSIDTPMGFDWDKIVDVSKRYRDPNADPNPPQPIPVVDPKDTPTWSSLSKSDLRVTWLIHSTALVEVDGYRVLTDPVFSERCSPSTAFGPKRFHLPALDANTLPPIDAIVISHDHYDHLDYPSVQQLAVKNIPFYVPLGIGDHLRHWGVPENLIHEMDWWDQANVSKPGHPDLILTATPARHFSGRGLTDRFSTLWSSWAIHGPKHSVYFGGDSGYFPGYKEIGQRLGPFDVALIPVGAYDPTWANIHLNPEEAITASEDVHARIAIPVHWGSFNLAPHAWAEPIHRMLKAKPKRDLKVFIPKPGESLTLSTFKDSNRDAWWNFPNTP